MNDPNGDQPDPDLFALLAAHTEEEPISVRDRLGDRRFIGSLRELGAAFADKNPQSTEDIMTLLEA